MNTMLKVAPADLRGARTIGDLPSAECCMVALKIATVNIAERIGCTFHTAIKSSIPVYRAFDLTINQARAHKEWLFAIYGWNTLIFNQSRQLRRSRSRLECEVRTQPFQTHSWLELLSLKGLSDVLRFPLYGRVLHTAFWPE